MKATKVTGLDTAGKMLDVAEKEALYYGVAQKLETVTGNWEKLPEKKAYDLVLAANAPAITDDESLQKMNRF